MKKLFQQFIFVGIDAFRQVCSRNSFHFNSFLYVVDQATQQTLGQDHFSNECQ